MSHELLESEHIFINPSTGLVSFSKYSQFTLLIIKDNKQLPGGC